MTDIVERVAKAIYGQLGKGSGDYGDAARAALAAMLEAVGEPVGWHYDSNGFEQREWRGDRREVVPRGWTETPLYSLAALREEGL